MAEKAKKARKKIGSIILYLIMAVLIVLLASSVYTKITGKYLLPYNILWVLSQSMEEEIPAKSYILVKKVDPKDIKVDDVITFYSRDPALRGNLNTHRVVEIIGDNEEFVTKGDNNIIKDSYHAYAEDVIARYECNLPLLTTFGRVLSTSGGLVVAFLGIIIAMISRFWIDHFKKKIEEEEEDEDAAEFDRLVAEEVQRLKDAESGKAGLSEKDKEIQRLIAEEVERLKQADEANKK